MRDGYKGDASSNDMLALQIYAPGDGSSHIGEGDMNEHDEILAREVRLLNHEDDINAQFMRDGASSMCLVLDDETPQKSEPVNGCLKT